MKGTVEMFDDAQADSVALSESADALLRQQRN
jgi:hypothetical protein